MAKKATPGATGKGTSKRSYKQPQKDMRGYHYEIINGKRVRVYDGTDRAGKRRVTLPNRRAMRP